MSGFVSKDLSDGRLMVWDGADFGAIFDKGEWSDGVFSADDLKDNFNRVTDEVEASKLLKEAKASLSV